MSANSMRWFDPAQLSEAARSLMSEVGQACDAVSDGIHKPRYSQRRLSLLQIKTVIFLMAVVGFLGAILIKPDLMPWDWLAKDNNLHSAVKYILIIVPIGFGVAAKARLRRARQRTDVHDSCIQKLTNQFPQLRDARLTPVVGPSVNVLPHLVTNCRAITRCSLFGEYRDQPLAMFESEYTAAATLDAKQVFDRAQAQLLSDPDKEQFSRLRTAEAIVFFRPQPQLPDMFLAGKDEPLSRYQSRWVKAAGGQPESAHVAALQGTKFEAFCHCAASAVQAISPELIELLSLRPKSLVQVMGGFVVIVPRSWAAATPMETATAAFEIQLDLDFACAVYHTLAGNPKAETTAGSAPHRELTSVV